MLTFVLRSFVCLFLSLQYKQLLLCCFSFWFQFEAKAMNLSFVSSEIRLFVCN
ncbi:hypothetical protein HID58_008200 [Brassica napus]|uniref:Uncharacterized protein n=1 Tax=Brassica napus TaxID=3708 RepID=A0ABQ8DPC1_BRANA|nr:hypothetical protein HID58_091656 [Brassica napus]KAH0915443.1 hypothetical protein HID58_029889 [Brassica napus]KAH0924790.1 hypothetical protein HID58_017046 [Brassica napus]KAH0931083.1 hypothetical protein HID58_008200 [Brassica napus]